jgi:IS1 family transposase
MECKKCGSTNTVKNGRTATGQQQYHCRTCGVYTVTGDRARERAIKMEIVDKLQRERVSQRGMARVTGISRPTITRRLRKKEGRPIGATILPTATRPEIEIDEQWSYVGKKSQVVWHWVAVERATRRVVGWAVGDRSAATCRKLWESLPADYRKRGIFSTDEYFVYRQVLPATRHRPRPKGHGATSQVDRAHNTFRQWCANLVRKTLSFSRDMQLHAVRLRIVVDAYNAERAGIWSYQ